jgi:hypothetical protein
MKEQKAKWKHVEIINGKKVECGCWVDSVRYIKICAKHTKEFDELHARAVADHLVSSKRFDEECDRHAKNKELAAQGLPLIPPPAGTFINRIEKVKKGNLTDMM